MAHTRKIKENVKHRKGVVFRVKSREESEKIVIFTIRKDPEAPARDSRTPINSLLGHQNSIRHRGGSAGILGSAEGFLTWTLLWIPPKNFGKRQKITFKIDQFPIFFKFCTTFSADWKLPTK